MAPIGPFDEPIPDDILKQVVAVVQRIEIKAISLVAVSCTLKATPPPKGAEFNIIDHGVKCGLVEGTTLPITVGFGLSARPHNVENGEEFFAISASFRLLYEGAELEKIPAAQIEAFASANAVHNAWPYWRELVQNLALRVGLAPLTIPLLKLQRPKTPSQTTGVPRASKKK